MQIPEKTRKIVLAGIGLLFASILNGQLDPVVDLSSFPVYAGAYGESSKAVAVQVGDRMRREVRVDMQTRGGPGYQSDISVRGGIFEGTGMMIGGLSLFDPQTGHYFSEIPLDPGFFSGARLLTGTKNGVYGFNSTSGSIDWEWAPIVAGGRISATVGTDNRIGGRAIANGGSDGGLQWQVGITKDKSDGSVEDGDFDLERISGRFEMPLGAGKLRLFGGYVEKFYGWPGMYTGFPSLSETEDYAISLLGWQWETGDMELGENRHSHRIGGYWRQLDDDYEFNRYSPNNFFEHLTEVWSLQGDGLVDLESVNLSYRWVLLKDEIRRSTSLGNGPFTEREYGTASVLLERGWNLKGGEISLYGGMGIDTSDKDETVGTPQAGVSWSRMVKESHWKFYTEYSKTSQVPGYTVLNSGPSGLFGGNPDLGRETADTVEAGFLVQNKGLTAQLVIFQREDEDLVDWVYDSNTPSARQASAVDLTVRGIEGWLRWEIQQTAFEIGYAALDKDPDYLDGAGDASFYALNYAKHRILASVGQELFEAFEVRLLGEYRKHPSNSLRSGGDEAFYLHLHASWKGFPTENWQLFVDFDNLTEEDFEPVPGTPGPGLEIRASLSYSW